MTQIANRKLGAALAKLSRPQNTVFSGTLTVIAAKSTGSSWGAALLCYLCIFGLYGIAASYNNLQDIAIDRINKRLDNPLVAGNLLSPGVVQKFILTLVIGLGILQLFLKQPASLIILLAYVGLLVAYSHPQLGVQRRGIFAHVLLAICYGVIPVLLGASQNTPLSTERIFLSVLLVTLLVPSLLAKDYKDLKGDKQLGKLTPLVRHGDEYVFHATLIWLVTAGLILFFGQHGQYDSGLIFAVFTAYSLSIIYLHHQKGIVPKYFLRLPQLTLLFLAWLVVH